MLLLLACECVSTGLHTFLAVVNFCADNPISLAHTSPDVQKLLESEQDWAFNVIELELLTKRRSVTQ